MVNVEREGTLEERQPEAANVMHEGGRAAVAIVADGPCVTETLQALEDGVGVAKPMARPALEKARAQAASLLERIVVAYEADVAPGEVGANGSARASTAPPLAGQCPTGLLYGRIQSGKTLAMIATAALALDNGFRVIVVLTADNVKLLEQTASRFSALKAILRSSDQAANWTDDANHIRKNLSDTGLVLVCQKNQSHLDTLVGFLQSIGATDCPALIMDDEADHATLDTTLNSRNSGRATAPKFASTINRRTVKNDRPDEAGRSVREVLSHFVFLQVTATPYALLLQNVDNPLRPRFTKLLEPGDGYTGGESFFSVEHVENELPPLMFVREEESDELERGAARAPPGLVRSLSFFLVAAGAQAVADPVVRARVQNFLCHTSQRQMEHERVSDLIRDYLEWVGDELRKPAVTGEVLLHLEKAYAELTGTVTVAPSLESIIADIRQRLPRRQVITVNSTGSNAEFTRGINFIIGGNILGRGLTIENLLVTYYLRRAKVSQMDTMLQHARMFGYRRQLMPYTRVALPERLALRFHRIHAAESSLRSLLSDGARWARIPVEMGEGLRVTRQGVLDTSCILAYAPGQHLYPLAPLVTRDAAREHEKAKAETLRLGGAFQDEKIWREPVEVSLEDLIRLLGLLPYDDRDEDSWDPKAIQSVLHSNLKRFDGRGLLFTRKMDRKKISQGALSGDELKRLRAMGKPVVCVFLNSGRQFSQTTTGEPYPDDFVYPSFVLPEDEGMPAHVFNIDE
jgi:hypothetical protein